MPKLYGFDIGFSTGSEYTYGNDKLFSEPDYFAVRTPDHWNIGVPGFDTWYPDPRSTEIIAPGSGYTQGWFTYTLQDSTNITNYARTISIRIMSVDANGGVMQAGFGSMQRNPLNIGAATPIGSSGVIDFFETGPAGINSFTQSNLAFFGLSSLWGGLHIRAAYAEDHVNAEFQNLMGREGISSRAVGVEIPWISQWGQEVDPTTSENFGSNSATIFKNFHLFHTVGVRSSVAYPGQDHVDHFTYTLTDSETGVQFPLYTRVETSIVGTAGTGSPIDVGFKYQMHPALPWYFPWQEPAPVDVTPDVTPPYVLKRILTSSYYGFATSQIFGFTPSDDRIDMATYSLAVGYCLDQGIKISVTYTDQNDFLSLANDLMSLYGGFLTDNDGMIQFGIVTSSDTPIRTIDNSHLVTDKGKPPIQVTKAALEDGYNKIQFNYYDRNLNYKQAQVEASDEVDMDINGPRIKTFGAQYVMAGSTAQMIATRALWQNLYGNDQYAFQLGWKDADLKPGALITLVDSFDPTLNQGVLARILKWQENKRGVFTVQAVQQHPYIISASTDYTNTASINQGFGSLVVPPMPPQHQTAYELPQEVQGSKAFLYFGYAPNAMNMGAQLYMSVDGENYILTQDAQPFIISGQFAKPLEKRHQNYVEDQVEFYLFPTTPFNVNTPTFVQTYELDDITAALRSQGAGTLVCGSEAIAFEGLTVLGQNHYKARRMFRGWAGTPITAHNSGEWFHQHAAGIFNHEISQDDIGKDISYKIVPYNFLGKGSDLSSIDAQSYHIQGLYWLPRAMSRLHVFVDSPLSFDPNTPVRGGPIAVFGSESPVTLKWSDSSNTDGFGAGGFGNNLYGHFTPDIPEPSYLIRVNSSNGVAVSSFIVTTGYFNYTVDQNSADWNGFQPDLSFNVQPFNTKGIGPTSATRSLMMF